ncbi:hypothetical protein LY78DRAFT_660328 [Colletotrichum sublineola]|nr:hypothetical protein LY78DRAFT_660328 [Colletotrichum sublineola]
MGPILDVNPNPWAIPTCNGVEEMISSAGRHVEESVSWKWRRRSDQLGNRYWYSAAAVAIRFLESLTKDSRSSIRNIVLDEDRAAVGFAESHGLG